MDPKNLFEFNLCSVPLALSNLDGSMSKCKESELFNEIGGGLSVEELDNTDSLSAVIKEFMVLLRMGCTNTTSANLYLVLFLICFLEYTGLLPELKFYVTDMA